LTHILIDREEHGYEVRGIPKIAMNGQSTAQIFLDDVRVPISNSVRWLPARTPTRRSRWRSLTCRKTS
jgi:alkylation response protein AidB-like acyl-CoA dehydrogenase